MNRRALLAGVSGSALTGCGLTRRLTSFTGRGRGCVDARPPAADAVLLVRGAVPTTHVRTGARFALVVPVAAAHVDAVAYVLPGRGSSADDAVNALGLDGFLSAYVRTGGHPFALAIVDAGESYFHPRASGEDRLALVTDDLSKTVRELLHVRSPREALLGYSMGGYGALLAAERAPARYRAVAVAGPALFPSYADERQSVADAFGSAGDFARYDVLARAGTLRGRPVQVWCGRNDPFLPGVRAFARACPNADVHVTAGCHDDGFWRTAAAAMIAFAGRHLGA